MASLGLVAVWPRMRGVREGDGEQQLTTGPINMTKGNLIFQASLVCDKIPHPRGRLLRSPISFHRMTGIL